MDRDSIVLRAAKPTLDDGLTFARYLDEAAEGFFRFMIGRHVERVIATAFLQPDHDLSYQNVTFAEQEGVIVGLVSGYTARKHRASSRRPLEEAAGRGNLRMAIVSVLFAPLMRIIESKSDEDFYIQAIAVSKELHGGGIGSALMDFREKQARACGSTRLALDVSAKNERARRFYSNRGMSVDSQWPRHLPIRALKLYRMTKKQDKGPPNVRQQKTRNMKLRHARAIDTEALFAIRCSVIENYQSQEELTNLGITLQSVKEMIEGGDYITTVAEEHGQPVGFSMAQISQGYIFACFVRPEFEGNGFGRALMDAAEEELRREGVQKAWLSTGPEPELRAVGFYLHLGWYRDGYLDDGQIIFRKTLISVEQDASADADKPRR